MAEHRRERQKSEDVSTKCAITLRTRRLAETFHGRLDNQGLEGWRKEADDVRNVTIIAWIRIFFSLLLTDTGFFSMNLMFIIMLRMHLYIHSKVLIKTKQLIHHQYTNH